MIEAHRSPEAMARCLVSYIADDARVRSEVYTTWGTSPGIHAIREMRRVKSKLEPQYDAIAGEDWRGDQMRQDMEIASSVFVRALEREKGI